MTIQLWDTTRSVDAARRFEFTSIGQWVGRADTEHMATERPGEGPSARVASRIRLSGMRRGSGDFPILIGAVLLFAVAFSSWMGVRNIEERTRRDIRSALDTVLGTTYAAVAGWATDRQSDARHIADRSDVRTEIRALLAMPRDRDAISGSQPLERLRKIMHPYLVEDRDLGFFIVAPDGINIASARDRNLGEPNLLVELADDPFGAMLRGSSRMVLPIESRVPLPDARGALSETQAVMFVGVPVFEDDDSVMAVFLIRIDPSQRFTAITQLARTGETGDTYAFNREAVMVSEGRFESQLREIGLLQHNQRSILSLVLRDPGGNLLEGHRPSVAREQLPLTRMAQQATAGRGGGDVVGYRDYRGVRVVGTWLWDEELGMGMTAEVDVAEAYETYFAIRRTIIIVLLVTTALFIGYVIALIARAREKDRLICELEDALENVKTLRGLIPICAACKKIRDDRGIWNRIEAYLDEHSDAELTHGICPDCLRAQHPEIWEELRNEGRFEAEPKISLVPDPND